MDRYKKGRNFYTFRLFFKKKAGTAEIKKARIITGFKCYHALGHKKYI
jgi:hypothetical protein